MRKLISVLALLSVALGLGATASAGTSPAYCGSTLPGGTYADVVVPPGATCTLNSDVTVQHDVKVEQGATLIDHAATIGHDIHADHPYGVLIGGTAGGPGHVGHDVHVKGVTGKTYLDGHNYVCNTVVGHDVTIASSAPSAGEWVIGDTSRECAGGSNTVGHDLTVQKNADKVDVSDNTIGHTLRVAGNTGGATVSDNHAAADAVCQKDDPTETGSGNTAGGKLTCPA